MIRAVFFDYDGVLTLDKTGSLTTCRHLAAASGLPFERVHQALRPHNEALTLGQTTHAQVWPAVCAALGVELDFGLLQAAFDSTPLRRDVFALAARLKHAGLVVGIVTDNKRDRIERLRAVQGLDEVFDPIVVSAEVGADKQEEAIFRHALARAGVQARDSVFIDNNEDNLRVPRHMGLHTVFFDDASDDAAGLAGRLLQLGLPAD